LGGSARKGVVAAASAGNNRLWAIREARLFMVSSQVPPLRRRISIFANSRT
jgi:hypothetical protein